MALVPKKTIVALVQNRRLGGSAKTRFRNANLGLPVQTRVEICQFKLLSSHLPLEAEQKKESEEE